MSCSSFYLWDVDFGPAFIKISTFVPYPIKTWVNRHDGAKSQAAAAGIGFSVLSNGFATCQDPAGLDLGRLGPGAVQAFFARWMSLVASPSPLTEHDRAASYWWALSMRQVEVSHPGVRRTTAGRRGRSLDAGHGDRDRPGGCWWCPQQCAVCAVVFFPAVYPRLGLGTVSAPWTDWGR